VIELFYSSSPNVYKVMIALAEAELEYELRFVDLSKGEQFIPEKLGGAISAKVPVLRDTAPHGIGEALTIMESGAILHYLAEKTGKLLPHDPRRRSEAMQWLFWQMANLGPVAGQYWHFRMFASRIEPETNFDYPRRRYTKMLSLIWGILERRLQTEPYLAHEYSVADIACYPWVRYLGPDDASEFPALLRWREMIAARPAVQAAYARNASFDTGYGRNERQGVAYPWEGLAKHTIMA